MGGSSNPLNIAIIGAGIGGLALAIGLLRQNVPYTLYEAAAEYSTIGAGVGLGPNALRAMDMIDPRFRALYEDISSGNLTPNKNHVMMDALLIEEGFGKNQGIDPASYGADCYDRTSCHRKALLDIMTGLIPLSTVRFNKRLKSLVQEKDKVIITFEDGEVTEANSVIGCDGVKGATRPVVLGEKYPEKVEATYSGKYAYRSIIPMKDAVEILGEHAGDAKMFMGPGVNMTTFPISKGTACNAVVFKLDDKPWSYQDWTRPVDPEVMFGDFSTGVDKRLVKLLEWGKPLQWSIWHHLDTPIYYNGLICLLGDSAHATTPHQAAGAGQCLEDALILSRLLGKVTSLTQVEPAYKIYDSIRRPRAQRVVRTSHETGLIYAFRHPDFGTDMRKIVEHLNERFLWLWEHDLHSDVVKAEAEFAKIIN
ncbi:hypothetical protein BP6252_02838 [Coleophoma cylindrospora]|uniref:FAD-binding domain-containing protein n=1 Tax=Coleophoma cylindrospora TaxID=1849047 RepID=A0A3D8SHL3_9HELO|nr:hypothetical protein BP6252_02838 [Coleophoma cylindrospora]